MLQHTSTPKDSVRQQLGVCGHREKLFANESTSWPIVEVIENGLIWLRHRSTEPVNPKGPNGVSGAVSSTLELTELVQVADANPQREFFAPGGQQGFSSVDRIFVHLEQLNTYQNAVGGAPSTLLDIITPGPARFGDILEVFRPQPLYKQLSDGIVSTLRLRLLDSSGAEIDNHGLHVVGVLEFRREPQ